MQASRSAEAEGLGQCQAENTDAEPLLPASQPPQHLFPIDRHVDPQQIDRRVIDHRLGNREIFHRPVDQHRERRAERHDRQPGSEPQPAIPAKQRRNHKHHHDERHIPIADHMTPVCQKCARPAEEITSRLPERGEPRRPVQRCPVGEPGGVIGYRQCRHNKIGKHHEGELLPQKSPEVECIRMEIVK